MALIGHKKARASDITDDITLIGKRLTVSEADRDHAHRNKFRTFETFRMCDNDRLRVWVNFYEQNTDNSRHRGSWGGLLNGQFSTR